MNDTKYKEMLHCTDRCCIVLNCNIVSTYYTVAKSVTAVDTISATVIFCFLLFCRRFLREIGDFGNISAVEQAVMSHLPQPGVPKARLGRIAIVIRIQTINYYFLY